MLPAWKLRAIPGAAKRRDTLILPLCLTLLAAALVFQGGVAVGSRGVHQQTTRRQLLSVFQGSTKERHMSGASPSVFVGVLSAFNRKAARDAIRATWGAHPYLHRVRFFVLPPQPGTTDYLKRLDKVQQEAEDKKDLVLIPHAYHHDRKQTYLTLEICRVAAASQGVTHVLKVNDNSYVRVHPLLERLPKLPSQGLLWGRVDASEVPQRKKGSKWYVSEAEWAREFYPPHVNGAGYVLSGDLAREIAAGAALRATPSFLPKEDVSMGVWLEWIQQRRGQGIHLVDDARFNDGGCADGDVVSSHLNDTAQLRMWKAGGHCI